MKRKLVVLLACVLICGAIASQDKPAENLSFQVATIKPSAPDTATLTQIRGSRFVTEGTTFLDLFKYAYNIHPDEVVGGPGWLRTRKFDVTADPETEKRPTSDQMKAMVQELLNRRFNLKMHRDQKTLPVYALLKSDEPITLAKSTSPPTGIPVVGYDARGVLEVGNATMFNLATFLQRFVVDRPTIDQTGIQGHYDLTLRWTPDSLASAKADTAEATAPPDLFTAIKEQLGLKLKPTKAPVDVYVIDSANQPVND
jgi:uncharacterized protein (TIGR03435 family)